MSNIYKTAEVQRLITPRKEAHAEAYEVFNQMGEEFGKDPDPETIVHAFVHNVGELIRRVEARCYSQMWDEANDIPTFDPKLEPKDCFHCKRMVKLRGEFCSGHLDLLGSTEPVH